MKKNVPFLLLSFFLFYVQPVQAQWQQTKGPEGGVVEQMVSNGPMLFAAAMGGGIFRSANCGDSWTCTTPGFSYPYFNQIACKDSIVYAGSYLGELFRSSNNGESWEVLAPLSQEHYSAIRIHDTSVFVATQDEVWRSNDQGKTWVNVTPNHFQFYKVETIVDNGIDVFVGGSGSTFRSSDNGVTWTRLNVAAGTAIAIRGTEMYASGIDGVFRSTDDGVTWTSINTGLESNIVYSILMSGSNVFAVMPNLGIWKSTDNGLSWNRIYDDFFDVPFKYAGFSNMVSCGNKIMVGHGGRGVMSSLDSGASWTPTNHQLIATRVSAIKIINDTNIIAGTSSSGIFWSTNGGSDWNPIHHSLTIDSTGYNTEFDAIVDMDTSILVGSAGGVYRSDDYGQSWSLKGAGMPGVGVSCLARNDANILFAGTIDGCYKSNNRGDTWTAANGATAIPNFMVSALAVDKTKLYAATYYGYIYVSADNGGSWSQVGNQLPFETIVSLVVMDSVVYAASRLGVYRKLATQPSWVLINSNNTYALTASNHVLYAGTKQGVMCLVDESPTWVFANENIPVAGVFSIAAKDSFIYAGVLSTGVHKTSVCSFLPQPIIKGAALRQLCNGDSMTLEVNYGNSFVWSNGETSKRIVVKHADTLTVITNYGGGCVSQSTPVVIAMKVDTSVTQTATLLKSNAVNASLYQWLNCSNGFAVVGGASQRVFTPTQSGYYAVRVTQNGCTDTSACYVFNRTGVEDVLTKEKIHVNPNPFTIQTIIESETTIQDGTLALYSLQGKLVKQEQHISGNAIVLTRDHLPAGIYFLSIQDGPRLFKTEKLVIMD